MLIADGVCSIENKTGIRCWHFINLRHPCRGRQPYSYALLML